MKYYVIDENNNLHEALNKEGVEALLAEAIQEGQLPSVDEDTAFVTMLKDPHTGETHKVAFLTQAAYNQLKAEGQLIENCYYFITDDPTADDLEEALVNVTETANQAKETADETKYLLDTATAINEYAEIEDFVKWAYPIAQGKPNGSVFTMHDTNNDYKLLKGISFDGGNSFIVAEFVLQGGGGEGMPTLHLISLIGIDGDDVDFTDYIMAKQSDIDALQSGKSDKPQYMEATNPSGTQLAITEKGLYAVSAMEFGGSHEYTFMLSIGHFNSWIYSPTFCDGTNFYWAEFDNDAKVIQAKKNVGGTVSSMRVRYAYLVAKY